MDIQVVSTGYRYNLIYESNGNPRSRWYRYHRRRRPSPLLPLPAYAYYQRPSFHLSRISLSILTRHSLASASFMFTTASVRGRGPLLQFPSW